MKTSSDYLKKKSQEVICDVGDLEEAQSVATKVCDEIELFIDTENNRDEILYVPYLQTTHPENQRKLTFCFRLNEMFNVVTDLNNKELVKVCKNVSLSLKRDTKGTKLSQ